MGHSHSGRQSAHHPSRRHHEYSRQCLCRRLPLARAKRGCGHCRKRGRGAYARTSAPARRADRRRRVRQRIRSRADRGKQALCFRSNWPLGIPLATFAVMFYLWWTRGRDPRLRPIAAQYEPPDQLTPGEAGTLVDNSADMRDITSTIVDLAVRGYIVIEEHQKDRMLGLFHGKDYNFILKKDRAEWAKLKPHEQVMLNGIFSLGTVGETVSMSSLENHFYTNLPGIKNSIFDSLVTHGYYRRRPDSVRAAYIGVAVVVGVLSIWGGSGIASKLGMAPLTFIAAG